MTPETIEALSKLPLDFVLIYIIVMQQKQINLLTERMVANANQLASLVVSYIRNGGSMDNDTGGSGES